MLYAGAALVLLGRQTVADPTHVCLCLGPGGDPPFFMWVFKWWPYAIGHGVNPFYSHLVWYPGGANIATVTGVPAVALVLWPVTSLLGPIVAYNVAALLGPVLSALAAYALCRYVARRFWPSVVGGFAFGFSSYELGQLMGHLHLTLVFLVPLIPLLVLRRRDGRGSRAGFVAALAAALAAEVLISTEIAFDLVLLGAFGLLAALATVAARERRALLVIGGEIIGAGLLALAVVSPYLYWALAKADVSHYGQVAGVRFAERYRLNPLNLIEPTPITWLGGDPLSGLYRFDGGNITEAGGYIGIPLLLVFGAFLLATWRRRATRFLVLMLAVSGVLALGPFVSYHGHPQFPLPWQLVEDAPVFKAVLPGRFVLFIVLIVAVGVALELARQRRRPWLAWAIAVAGIAAVLPDPTAVFWHSRPGGVPLVVADAKRYLPSTGSVLMVPVGQLGESMYWHAQAGFPFPLANGRVALVLPPEYSSERAALDLANAPGPPRTGRLREFLATHRVTTVVVQPALRAAWDPELRHLGLTPRDVAGVAVYYVCPRVAAGAPCDLLRARPVSRQDLIRPVGGAPVSGSTGGSPPGR